MVRVKIDDRYCDLSEDFVLPETIFVFDGQMLTSPSFMRTGRSIELLLHSSPNNDSIVGYAADPYVAERFNASYHEGVIEVDGVALLTGVAHLEGVESKPDNVSGECRGVSYRMSITGGGAEWAKRASKRKIGETALDYSASLDGAAIESSWEEQSPVKFLPVFRDQYLMSEDDSTLYPPQRMLTVGDYHPFISVVSLLNEIFAESGYTIHSNFLNGDLARTLHLSGCVDSGSAASVAKLTSLTGFMAGRREEATTTADYAGRVYLSPLVLSHSLGNFVQTTDKIVNESFYNNGNALSITDEGITYAPRTRVSVAFDLYLKYTTACRILSRERLQGFDTIYVDTGCQLHFNIANPYRDHREELTGSLEYLCLIFDFAEGQQYRIRWSTTSGEKFTYITSRATKLTSPSGVTGCELMRLSSSGMWLACEEDWALYDGYLEEQTQHQVEVTIRTMPEELSPSKSKSFSRMYIEGGEAGQSITLSAESTMQPVFGSSLGYGSQVDGAAVLKHGFTQMELIEALQQMFNLRIVTHSPSRSVWIEPRDDHYTDALYDWSDRVVTSEPISAVDMAAEVAAMRKLTYRGDGGGAVTRFNADNLSSPLGEWSLPTDSYIAKDKVSRCENPLFCPTLSITAVVGNAASAALLSVGDRDVDALGESAIRIVSYRGLQPLFEGEQWGFPSDGAMYPFAAYHYVAGATQEDGVAMLGDAVAAGPDESFTLCYEDRDGVSGLHRYYDRQWRAEASRRKLSLSIRIGADELMALNDFQAEGPDIRSLYRFEFCGQRALYRMVGVEGYDAERGVARICFAREIHD